MATSIIGTRLQDMSQGASQSKLNGGKSATELKKLQDEIDTIRRSLADLDAHSLLQKLHKLQEQSRNEMDEFDDTEIDFTALKSEFIDLTTKHKFLTDLAEGKYDADGSSENFVALQKEVEDLKQSNSSTVNDIEGLIRTILKDAKAMETLLSSTETSLNHCEMKVQELSAADERSSSLQYDEEKAAHELDMLNDSIRMNRLEELSLTRQIEEKARELEELDKLEKLNESYAQDNIILEALKGVSVLSMSGGHISLQLKTYVSDMPLEEFKDDPKKPLESEVHKLDITVDPATLSILQAELTPKSVDIGEIVSEVQDTGARGDFFEKLSFLVKQVQLSVRSRSRNTNGGRSKRR